MKPTFEHESERLCGQFFRPDFITQRLGAPGTWQGEAMTRVGVENPLRAEPLANLLSGYTADRAHLLRDPLIDNPVRAWRFSLGADPALNTVWALSEKPIQRQIRLAHTKAVEESLKDFASTLNGNPRHDSPTSLERKLALFAKFESGASRTQAPQLETNIFLFNFIIQRGGGGGLSAFTEEQTAKLEERAVAVYRQALERDITWTQGRRIEIPSELSQKFQDPANFGPVASKVWADGKALQGEELFACWREQGRSWHWEPARVARLQVEARRTVNLPNVVRGTRNVMRFGAVWMHKCALEAKKVMDVKREERKPAIEKQVKPAERTKKRGKQTRPKPRSPRPKRSKVQTITYSH